MREGAAHVLPLEHEPLASADLDGRQVLQGSDIYERCFESGDRSRKGRRDRVERPIGPGKAHRGRDRVGREGLEGVHFHWDSGCLQCLHHVVDRRVLARAPRWALVLDDGTRVRLQGLLGDTTPHRCGEQVDGCGWVDPA